MFAVFFVFALLTACAPPAETAFFIPPTAPASPPSAATIISLWTATPTEETGREQSPTPETIFTPPPTTSETPTPENCTNDLKYLTDLTVPDGSPVNPGEKIDKQWLVQNSGTCNWDDNYRLKLVNGFQPLGAETTQLLFPARADNQVTIQIFFTAPTISGVYRSAWQAYDQNGLPFGETIYIEITVP
ncbi:MAG: hypothetical protein L6461_17730 [Anaerolineae bacterium]|nr:hypothetical protein [Anaerolineae bacterium]